MRRLTSLITADNEFESLIALAKEELRKDDKLPIAVNGLSGGAHYAFVVEAARSLFCESRAPVLVLAGNDAERDAILECLLASGVKALAYKRRDFVFHNISLCFTKIFIGSSVDF